MRFDRRALQGSSPRAGGARAALLLLALGCHHAPPATSEPAPPQPRPADCLAEQSAILQEIARSATLACATDADCALVIGPTSPSRDDRQVVHVQDRERLEAASRAHLSRCAVPMPPFDAETALVLTPICTPEGCRARETTLHLDPLEP